jgi:glutathione S-transferase
MAGHEVFERLSCIHLNIVEGLVLFVPMLWMAAKFRCRVAMAGIGGIFLLGRGMSCRGYVVLKL